MEIKAGSAYSVYDPISGPLGNPDIPVKIPEIRERFDKLSSVIVPDGTSTIEVDTTAFECIESEYNLKVRYFHIVTEAESKSTTDVTFKLPEHIANERLLLINSKYGIIEFGDYWRLSNDGWYVTINIENVELEEGMVLELYVYREVAGDVV